MTATQATDFTSRYQIIDHRSNDDIRFATLGANNLIGNGSGLSATLLLDSTTGQYTLSVRSTEYTNTDKGGDWDRDGFFGADGEILYAGYPGVDGGPDTPGKGFAFAQITALEEYYQTLIAQGLITADTKLNLSGYSLGGHVASTFAAMHPANVIDTYLFNAPGHGGYDATQGSIADLMADFKTALAAAQSANPTDAAVHQGNIYASTAYQAALTQVGNQYNLKGASIFGSATDDPNVTSLVGLGAHNDSVIVAGTGVRETNTPLFIEDQPDVQNGIFQWTGIKGSEWAVTHSITLMADSLAVMSVFERLGLDMSADTGLRSVYNILAGGNNELSTGLVFTDGVAEKNSLENALAALYKLVVGSDKQLLGDNSVGGFGNLTNREMFYQALKEINLGIDGIAPTSFESIVGDNADTLLQIASDTTQPDRSMAYRYALLNGNPFVVTNFNYSSLNTAHQLELHNPEAHTGDITYEYLKERAAFMERKIYYNLHDASYIVKPQTASIPTYTIPGYDINDPYNSSISAMDQYSGEDVVWEDRTVYQAQVTDAQGNLVTVSVDPIVIQRIETVTSDTKRVIFGSSKSETDITGANAADALFGMAGDDTLTGHKGNDYLEGGRGNDTYKYTTGDGLDTLFDADGNGSIEIDGNLMSGGEQYGDMLVYRGKDANGISHLYTFVTGDREHGGDLLVDGAMLIKDWRPDEDKRLGIDFTDAVVTQIPQPPAMLDTTREIMGDRKPAEYTATLALDASPDPNWFILTKKTVVNYRTENIRDADGNIIGTTQVPDTRTYTYQLVDDLGNWVPGAAEQNRADSLNGSSDNDHIASLGGNDTINAVQGGDDFIETGDGNNTVYAGAGNDIILGDLGNDTINAGDGNNYIAAGGGTNSVGSGSGNDYIQTGAGRDTILAGDGDNFVEAGAECDVVYGGKDKDMLIGGADSDVIDGRAGDDKLYGDTQMDTATAIDQGNKSAGTGQIGDWLNGGDGSDILVGSNGKDLLAGGAGGDMLIGGAGDDLLVGDNNIMPYDFPNQSWHSYDNDTQIWLESAWNIPAVPETSGNDVIYAGEGNDFAFGDYGNDVIFGEKGIDRLFGNSGNDVLLGGDDNDYLFGDTQENYALIPEPGNDYLDGGAGDDFLYGYEGDDILIGGKNDDQLVGGAGQDTYIYNIGDGIDHIIDSQSENNILRFGAGVNKSNIKLRLGSLMLDLGNGDALHIDNFFKGDVFNSSSISSFEFADGSALSINELLARGFDLDGTAGDDTICGTNAVDRINGLAGNDILAGGAGDDTYLFGFGSGKDTVVDHSGNDIVQMSAGVSASDVNLSRDGMGNLLLTLSGGTDSINLFGWYGGGYWVSNPHHGYWNTDFNYWEPGASAQQQVTFSDGTVWDLTQMAAQLPILGSEGNDALYGDSDGNTYLFGFGSGKDTVLDFSGNNTVQMSTGVSASDVTLSQDGDFNLVMALTGGHDTLTLRNWYNGSNYQNQKITFADGTVWGGEDLIRMAAQAPILGTEGDDVLYGDINGTSYNDWYGNQSYIGMTGNRLFNGMAGDDTMYGSYGNDTYLFGFGSGKDTILDNYGNNTVQMSAGVLTSDVTFGRDMNGNTVMTLAGGADTVTVNAPSSSVATFADGTVWDLTQMTAQTPISGTDGNDVLRSHVGNDIFNGMGGDDAIYSGFGDNTYQFGFGSGKDTVWNYYGNHTVQLSAGVSASDMSLGWDKDGNLVLTLTGGADTMTLKPQDGSFSNFQAVFADGTVWDLTRMAEQTPILGTDGNDVLRGGVGNNILNGMGGNDTIIDGRGNDTFLFGFGSGKDFVQDYLGNNTVQMLAGVSPADVTLSRATNNKLDLVLTLAGGADAITLKNGSSCNFQVSFTDGTVWDLSAMAALLPIFGTDGNDVVEGGVTNNTLMGMGGDDMLVGFEGDDVLSGGTGNDVLNGGAGDDTYMFNAGDGADSIVNMQGNDTLVIGDSLTGLQISKSGSGAVIAFAGTTDAITVGDWRLTGDVSLNIRDSAGNLLGDVWHMDGNYGYDTFNQSGYVSRRTTYHPDGTYNRVIHLDDASILEIDFAANDSRIRDSFFDATTGIIYSETYNADGSIDMVWTNPNGTHGTLNTNSDGLTLGTVYYIDGSYDLTVDDNRGNGNFTLTHFDSAGVKLRESWSKTDGSYGSESFNLDGSSNGVQITGSAADDVIVGTSANDVLTGGAGNDTLSGGAGNDTYIINAGDGVVTIIDDFTGTENNTIVFGVGVDPANVRLFQGSLGIDLGNGTVVHIQDVNYNDIANTSSIQSFQFADGTVLSAQQLVARGFESVGGSGNDSLSGTNVTDRMNGGAGNDVLDGGSGDDSLTGGSGNDTLIGGAGNDSFIFNAGDGADVILDSAMSLSGAEINTLVLGTGITADMITPIVDADGMVTLDFGNGDSIRINQIGNLSVQNIQFADGSVVATATFFNASPVAADDTVSIAADAVQTVITMASLLSNDADSDTGDTLSMVGFDAVTAQGNAVTQDANGNLVLDMGNNYQALGAGQTATDSFSYTIADAAGASSTATVAITIAGMNDAPVSVMPIASRQSSENTPFSFAVPTGTFIDIDNGDVLTYAATLADGSALPSWLVFDAAAQTFSGTPGNGDVGMLNVHVSATDQAGASVSATFALDVLNVNDAPVASDDAVTASNTATVISVASLLANDYDIDVGDSISLTGFDAITANGNTVMQDAAGNLVFDPSTSSGQATGNRYQYLGTGQSTTDSFTYTITDTAGATNTASVNVTITGANDAPVVVADTASVQEELDITAAGNVLANDSDVDQGTILSVADAGTKQGLYGSLTLGADGSYAYQLDNASQAVQSLGRNAQVTEHFGYTVTDGIAGTASGLDILINGSNDAPVLTAALADQNAVSNQAFSWQMPAGSFTDIDTGDTLAYTATQADGTALPSWLTFDATTRTFSGQVPQQAGFVDVMIAATDVAADGSTQGSLAASDVFRITVTQGNNGGGHGSGHSGSHGGNEHHSNGDHDHGRHDDHHDRNSESHAKGKKDDDIDDLIRDWFKKGDSADRHGNFDELGRGDNRIDHQANRNVAHGISNDYSKQWAQMNAKLKEHMAQNGNDDHFDTGASHDAPALFGTSGAHGLSQLGKTEGVQMKSFAGLKEGLERLGC